jgi:hypothetical protein
MDAIYYDTTLGKIMNTNMETGEITDVNKDRDGIELTAPTAPTATTSSYPDLSSAIEFLRQNIAALDPLYQTKVARAIESYDIAMNERNTNFNKAKSASDESAISNDQSVLQSRNAIDKNARMSSEDIMSILGAIGMGGSTRNKALSTIADKSNSNMNEANYGYGKNKRSILQSWNDFMNEDSNQQKQIADTKNFDIAEAGIARDTSKKSILQQIASNKLEMGQGIDDITGEMAGLDKNIADLSGVKKSYTGITPTYAAPSISEILGQNLSRFDVGVSKAGKKSAPKLIKVNEQTGDGSKYGLV